MCGIAGILDLGAGSTPSRAVVERMVAMLRTRGPDGTGYHVRGPVALGHARLSIIDIEGGRWSSAATVSTPRPTRR